MSEVTLPLFTDLARDEGPSLSRVPVGPPGQSWWDNLLTSPSGMACLSGCPALLGPPANYFLGPQLLIHKRDDGFCWEGAMRYEHEVK